MSDRDLTFLWAGNMAFQLDEDDQVLAAALSLVDEFEASDAGGASPNNKKRKKRKCDPNRARAAQHQELLALRELVPKLQKRLQTLEEQNRRQQEQVAVLERNSSFRFWRQMATLQRQTRANAEEENQRLRSMLLEQQELSSKTVQKLLQPGHGQLQTHPRRSSRRTYAVPVDRSDGAVFREMAGSIDQVYRQVLQVYCRKTRVDEATFGSEHAHRPVFADKILPFEYDATGAAAWQYFAHSFGRPTSRFYYHADSPHPSGLVSDDTVVESYGEEHQFGQLTINLKIKQIVRLYTAANYVVVVWRSLLSPDTFKGESLAGIVFEEKGALVIEPHSSRDRASIVQTWQMITPDLYGSANEAQRPLVEELTDFVVAGCRPGRAVESIERTLTLIAAV